MVDKLHIVLLVNTGGYKVGTPSYRLVYNAINN